MLLYVSYTPDKVLYFATVDKDVCYPRGEYCEVATQSLLAALYFCNMI